MYKKIIWYTIVVCFVIGFGMFAAGFYKAFQVGVGKVQESEVVQEKSQKEEGEISENIKLSEDNLEFFVLGDSLGRGTGDEKRKGFAENVVEHLKASKGVDITLNNAAVEGLKSRGLAEQLTDPKIKQGVKKAKVIFLSIGGNDLRAVQREDVVQRDQSYGNISSEYMENLKEIIISIREINPKGIIVFLGLYNLNYTEETASETSLLMDWNYNTQQLIEIDRRAIYIPTYDLFKLNAETFMSPDRLHPNSLGYEAIGKRMADVLEPLF